MLLLVDSSAFIIRCLYCHERLKRKYADFKLSLLQYASNKLKLFTDEAGIPNRNVFMVFESLPLQETNPRRRTLQEYKAIRNETVGSGESNLSYKFALYMKAQGMKIAPSPGNMEADDMTALVVDLIPKDKKIGILTTDKDLLQLIADNVTVYLIKNRETLEVNSENFESLYYGLRPYLVKYYLALVGDKSDGYKGVPGVGKHTALRILKESHPSQAYGVDSPRFERSLISNIEEALAYRGASIKEFQKSLYISSLYPTYIKMPPDTLKALEVEISECVN